MKIDKTEAQAKRDYLAGCAGRTAWDGIKAALDLEFREEAPELPDELGVGVIDGRPLLTRDWTGGPFNDYETWNRIYAEAARRYNAYPKLEALARELGECLRLRYIPEGARASNALSRLRELLGEEG